MENAFLVQAMEERGLGYFLILIQAQNTMKTISIHCWEEAEVRLCQNSCWITENDDKRFVIIFCYPARIFLLYSFFTQQIPKFAIDFPTFAIKKRR